MKKLCNPVKFEAFESSELYGKWFVPTEDGDYLHNDGIVRVSTRNFDTDKYTGYFDTESEALAAMDKYQNI